MTRAAKLEHRSPRYRLYVDESGDHSFNLLDNPGRRYLALLGVWFQMKDDYPEFVDQLEEFKRGIFGPRPDSPVILHRSDIINRKGPFHILCDPVVREQFNARLVQVIQKAKFKIVCAVIDKRSHYFRYSSPFHPYHYCLAAILDRYSGWLNFKNAVGDVLAESRGREEDLQLKQAYTRVYESGTLMFGHEHHQRALTSKDIKLDKKSANIPGLQLADLLAYPVKQSCLIERRCIPDPGDTFGRQLLAAVPDEKFNRHEGSGKIDGYGKIWL